ncbi:hypothetical protein P280DRAFT_529488 [Massarina eburnea CBS 473.64]|uniref:Uncharacterized protein n=1 Tax=Massarina eburnea CBS 473.64 TaxID=1395130 RepID=A0A6A6RRE0_9PLEO|nr:hypothetical protein P280DRAFT_529488 [Massarina eburnea CBS 473.64]
MFFPNLLPFILSLNTIFATALVSPTPYRRREPSTSYISPENPSPTKLARRGEYTGSSIQICGLAYIVWGNETSAPKAHGVPLLAFGTCHRVDDNSVDVERLGTAVDKVKLIEAGCYCSFYGDKESCDKGIENGKGEWFSGVNTTNLTQERRWVNCRVEEALGEANGQAGLIIGCRSVCTLALIVGVGVAFGMF